MARMLILGSNPRQWWVQPLLAAGYSIETVWELPSGSYANLGVFLESIPKDLECLVIDLDSLNPDDFILGLDIPLLLRLMVRECRQTALAKIILVSELGFKAFSGYGEKSMVLMTQGIELCNGAQIATQIDFARPLTPAEYVSGFLDLIKIMPQEKVEGRHSIANEWGAQVLANVISEGIQTETIISKSSSFSPYFLYSSLVPLTAEEIERIVKDEPKQFLTKKITVQDAFDFLLIDDEAAKGWTEVLSKMMPMTRCDVWDRQTRRYEEISGAIRERIERGDYKLIFLDLRMAGAAEEKQNKPEEFSGMKILRAIKRINPGQQVIMLTATNKGWNVKAMLEAGANGYYMKESPEYHFPISYSVQNAEAFQKTIKDCLEDSYLVDIKNRMRMALGRLADDESLSDLHRAVKTVWDAAFMLLSLHRYRDALLQLMMAVEAYANKYTREQWDERTRRFLWGAVYEKEVVFDDEDSRKACGLYIYDNDSEISFYAKEKKPYMKFQRGKRDQTFNIKRLNDSSSHRIQKLSLSVRIAAVLDTHLHTLDDMKRVCELIFIRNNRLAHHGSASEYIEENRRVTVADCRLIFDLTYRLIMA